MINFIVMFKGARETRGVLYWDNHNQWYIYFGYVVHPVHKDLILVKNFK